MQIILRKVSGISGLTALMRPAGGPSFGNGASPGAIVGFLLSPLVLVILAIAFIATWFLAGGGAPDLALVPFAGTLGASKLKELRQQRSKHVADARALTDLAEKEGRSLNAEEETRFNKHFADAQEVGKTIEREERLMEAERELAEKREKEDPGSPENPEKRTSPRGTPEYRAAYDKLLRFGRDALDTDERRALSVGTDTAGGFLTAPEQMVTELIKAIDNVVHIRSKATKIPVPTAQSLGAPSLDTDPDDADWTSELKTGNEDSAMAFGKRKLEPHPLAKRIKVSNDFLRMAIPGIGGEALVRERLGYKFGVSQEKAFLTANGAGRPLGAFTASTNGISTARDVSTGNTATEPTFDGLISAKYALKGAYWNEAEWMFHRDVLAVIAKLKDGNGQYIWRESVRTGEPDRVLNLPVAMSEYAPSTMTTGQYVGILAVWRFYWIADALDLQIKRLDELYAETNQTGFIGRMNLDGMPVLEEAFVRVKLA
jgi:HK97 family phage major capsid protein